MKHRTFLIAAALAGFVFTGCSKSGSQVQVVSAVFGEYTNFADVTPRVQDLIRLHTGFKVQTTSLQADPFPYYHKVLVITYVADGGHHIFTASENDTVSAEILLQAAKQ